jgi:WD40 repeat protein
VSIPAAVLSIVSYCKVEVYGELMRYLIQSIMEYEEHEKRAWSVDFSRTDPTMLVSGSDDGKVKVWCTRQEISALNIDMKANICCVKYNPGSSNFVAVTFTPSLFLVLGYPTAVDTCLNLQSLLFCALFV